MYYGLYKRYKKKNEPHRIMLADDDQRLDDYYSYYDLVWKEKIT